MNSWTENDQIKRRRQWWPEQKRHWLMDKVTIVKQMICIFSSVRTCFFHMGPCWFNYIFHGEWHGRFRDTWKRSNILSFCVCLLHTTPYDICIFIYLRKLWIAVCFLRKLRIECMYRFLEGILIHSQLTTGPMIQSSQGVYKAYTNEQ